ncbi:MAG: sigma-54-dependent Fis family transcriptional regulator [Hyphomicrobium sp.]|uniref:sigma-54-dependent transcriptional regulator n=1 Tax=Hyphomicrobium sp. CS1BSMeth3 TaxID=1892844 RepID=UPI0009308A48|nr:sigma-54 dependent transcriptional regulator [Hyphomicrobium sp. CS1BSMeth3]MBN9261241.1 sigma-54-dependent Fis family transcriptional regulator [Hyphomicrobium sp.]MBN9266374.1 sigma-54-dependent Fis family transcriptional regulator [Hyphomicrobium sp.]
MPDQGLVLFVDDEEAMREAVGQWLRLAGFELIVHDRAAPAIAALSTDFPGVLVTDLKMEGTDGMELLRQSQNIDPELPVIVITGHGDVETAVDAMRLGAYDFIEKPFEPKRLLEVIRNAAEKRKLVTENRRLRRAVAEQTLGSRIVGTSQAIERLRASVAELAATDVSVIIFGETGAGKDLVARCLHDFGRRHEGHYVAINCAAIPETMAESELFGYETGAFTGAAKGRIGKLEHASGGTLFLDEIDSMPLSIQGKLLRALQERVVERLGSNRSHPIDLRAIAASKIDLRQASSAGRFRSDLYYRLSVVELTIPPLRQRKEDIPLLFEYFASLAANAHGRERRPVPAATVNRLLAYDWPGNVRELRNAAERFALGLGGTFWPDAATEPEGDRLSLAEQVDAFERSVIERCLAESGGKLTAVMERLNIPRRTLSEKMAKYGLDRRRFTDQG